MDRPVRFVQKTMILFLSDASISSYDDRSIKQMKKFSVQAVKNVILH